eukprot:1012586-Rhodomonas_salina.1
MVIRCGTEIAMCGTAIAYGATPPPRDVRGGGWQRDRTPLSNVHLRHRYVSTALRLVSYTSSVLRSA